MDTFRGIEASYFRFPDGACVGGPSEGRPLEPVAVRIEGGLVFLA